MITKLPLQSGLQNYEFSTVLRNIEYIFTMRWDMRAEMWFFDLALEDGTILVHGIRVALGAIMTRRLTDVRAPNGMLIAIDTSDAGLDAGIDDLGSRVEMWFLDRDEFTTPSPATKISGAEFGQFG